MKKFPRALALLLIVFALVALFYSIIIPIFEGPDEDDHFRFAKFIADNRALPVQLFEPGGGIAGHQGWHPPLYYSLVALVIAPLDTSDHEQHLTRNYAATFVGDPACCGRNIYYHFDSQNFPYTRTPLAVHLARLLSIFFSAITVAATFFITATILESHHELPLTTYHLPLLAAAFVAFNPSFLFASALVSNDASLAALSSLVLLMWTRWLAARAACDLKSSALIGVLLALALLTKTTALGLVPLAILVFAYLAFRARNLRLFISTTGIFLAIILFVAGWWFARNQMVYGDPLALKLVQVSALFPRSGELTPPELFQISLPWMWQTFWGGPTPGDFSPALLIALALFTFVALLGFTFYVLRFTHHVLRIPLFFLTAWLAFIFIAQLRFITMTTGADQGRYLFPAISVIALILALVFQEIMFYVLRFTHLSFAHFSFVIPSFVICSFFILALFVPFAYTLPAYARPARASANDLARITNHAQFNFADQIELLGYDLESRVVKPGENLRVTLYWRARAPMRESYRVFVHVIGKNDVSAGGADVIPARGAFPTLYWKPGDALRDGVTIPILPNATPGKYALEIGLYPVEKNGARLSVIETGDDRALVDAIKIAPRHAITIAPRVGAPFGDAIELADYAVETTQDHTRIILYWRARTTIEQDYTMFAHALDANGKMIGQVDQQPQAGNYPTSIWSAGEIIRDEFILPLSPRVIIGLYRADTGERLPTPNGDSFELNLAGTNK
ncbi:MAG: hypothetical protein HZC40_09115 [Chloroflexi bacterium]|nr:hypothetical protein [Chloroflexota bacterium]